MKNHKFVDDVATKILRYNNKIYLSDIKEIIKKNIYNKIITNELKEIIKKLDDEKKINFIINIGQYNENELKTNIKYHLFRIMNETNGKECLLNLVNDD